MFPLTYVVFTLVAGIDEPIDKQSESVRGLMAAARYVTVISRLIILLCTSLRACGLADCIATTVEQVGYSTADFVAKALLVVLIYAIAVAKSEEEGGLVK